MSTSYVTPDMLAHVVESPMGSATDVRSDNSNENAEQKGSKANAKVSIESRLDNTSKTYLFSNEDHTMGNAMRYALMRDKRTAFAGYTIPHPSECTVKLRLQTHQGSNSDEVLRDALVNLMQSCDILTEKFTTANRSFDETNIKNE
eukprot:g1260.t1